MNPPETCRCHQPPFHAKDFQPRHLGVDKTDGRFADVSLLQCGFCGTWWLEYAFSVEGFSESGRWFRVKVEESELPALTAANAAGYLEKAESHFAGGSYFRTTCQWVSGGVAP
jgi:hypothetical protein